MEGINKSEFAISVDYIVVNLKRLHVHLLWCEHFSLNTGQLMGLSATAEPCLDHLELYESNFCLFVCHFHLMFPWESRLYYFNMLPFHVIKNIAGSMNETIAPFICIIFQILIFYVPISWIWSIFYITVPFLTEYLVWDAVLVLT